MHHRPCIWVITYWAERVLFILPVTVQQPILFIAWYCSSECGLCWNSSSGDSLVYQLYCSSMVLFTTADYCSSDGYCSPSRLLFIRWHCSWPITVHPMVLFAFAIHRPIRMDVPKSGVNTCPPVSEYNILCSEILLLAQRSIWQISIHQLLVFWVPIPSKSD